MPNRYFRYDCPHCHMNTLFPVVSVIEAWNVTARAGAIPFRRKMGSGDITQADIGTCCPECRNSSVLILESPVHGAIERFITAGSDDEADLARDKIIARHLIVRSGPTPLGHLPAQIQGPFADALRDAQQHRNPAGIMAVARGCLDVALKELGQTAGGRKHRIQGLCEQGVLTKQIGVWANRLWEEGGDAVHDLSATHEQAKEHIDFLVLFFDVAFGLPLQIIQAEHSQSTEVTG